ncbi:MAG: aromatic ring-hydroxylating dioxygenase subunit alpha [Acidobacteriota bacterium]
MNFKDFWYVAATSRELKKDRVIAARILDHWIALFRDERGRAVALEDRCLHRSAQLSRGRVCDGRLRCAYHGWVYDGEGRVVRVPSEGPNCKVERRARAFAVCEADDYVYARLSENDSEEIKPFRIPFYQEKGWGAIRLVNRFHNTVLNCAENFVDIPHTAFVHPRIFRVSREERLTASVKRSRGSVVMNYRGERGNLGVFSWFLNPKGEEIAHTDSFHMPNVTSVDYRFSPRRRFIITSQSVPVSDEETLVYTDLTFNYGIWNRAARPVIRWQAQKIIDQDIEILGNQMEVIKKFGARFSNTQSDIIHVLIESIHKELIEGRDPRLLPEKNYEIEFWV